MSSDSLLEDSQTTKHLAVYTEPVPTLEQAYQMYRRQTFLVCLRMAHGNQALAEDWTQDVFVHLCRKIGGFRGEAKFSTWLHRITVNVVLMKLRGKRLKLVSLEALQEPDADGSSPDIGLLQRALKVQDGALTSAPDRATLTKLLDTMPTGYRLALELHDIQGFEHQEIAELLGTSPGSSKSQLHKARLWLCDRLGVRASAELLESACEEAEEIVVKGKRKNLDTLLDGFDQYL